MLRKPPSPGDGRPRSRERTARWVMLLACAGLVMPPASAAQLCGLDGAFAPAASGPNAAAFNPALLGAAPHEASHEGAPAGAPARMPAGWQVELFGLEAGVGNESLTLRQYAGLNGAFWDENDKDQVLASIEGDQLDVRGAAQARVAGVSWGRWAFGTRTRAEGRIAIPKQAVELMLQGNTVGETFSVEGAAGEAVAFTEYRIGAAVRLRELVGEDGLLARWFGEAPEGVPGASLRDWRAGLTLKMIQAWHYAGILEAEGGITTTDEVLYGDGSLRSVTARGGRGWGADLGCAGPLGEAWSASLVVADLLSRVTFTDRIEERLDTFDVSGLTIGDEGEAVVTSETVTVALSAWEVALPARFSLGFVHHGESALTSVRIDLAAEDRLGASRSPRVGAGYARHLRDWLVVRGTVSVGGLDRASLGGELGLGLGRLQWDAGIRSWGSLNPWDSRGLGLVAGLSLIP